MSLQCRKPTTAQQRGTTHLRQQVTLELKGQLRQLVHFDLRGAEARTSRAAQGVDCAAAATRLRRVDSSDSEELAVRRQLDAVGGAREVELLYELDAPPELLILAQRLALLFAEPLRQRLAARDVVNLRSRRASAASNGSHGEAWRRAAAAPQRRTLTPFGAETFSILLRATPYVDSMWHKLAWTVLGAERAA